MASAQSCASPDGYPRDPTGARDIGSGAQVQGVDTGPPYEALTDDAGAILFPQFPLGRYSLTVEQAGMPRYEERDFPSREAWRLQFRADFFKFFNRVNFSNPVGNRNSPNFGRILSASDPRITQLALRLEF